MGNWQQAYDAGDWASVENWWRASEDLGQLCGLLEQLKRDVPRVVWVNGMEEREEFVLPRDAPRQWKAAATMLFMGELEAKIMGNPQPEHLEWQETCYKVIDQMRAFLTAQEQTKGHQSMSRAAHAETVLELLATIDRDAGLMCAQLDPAGDQPEDREWLRAVIAQAALAAFHAGSHARAAVGKAMEQHAVRGKIIQESGLKGGRVRAEQKKELKQAIIDAMGELIAKGLPVSAAAQKVAKRGIGASAEGNRTAYKRHLRAKKIGPTPP